MGIVAGMNRERMKGWEGDIRSMGGSSADRRCKGEGEVKKPAEGRPKRI